MRRLRIASLIAGVLLIALAAVQCSAGEYLVVITAKGKRYHRPDCRTVKACTQALTVEEAQSRGYTPCKVCKP